MAAFSRGSAFAARTCNACSFTAVMRSTCNSSDRTILRSVASSLRSFSHSTQYQAKASQKLPPKAIARKIRELKQEVQDRKAAQEQVEKMRLARREEEINAERDRQRVLDEAQARVGNGSEGRADGRGAGKIAVTTKASLSRSTPSPSYSSTDTTSSSSSSSSRSFAPPLPLNQYRPTNLKRTYQPDELDEMIANRDNARHVAEIMKSSTDTTIYRAPPRRWHLGAASLTLSIAASTIIALTVFWQYLNASTPVFWLYEAVYGVMIAMAIGVLWLAWRRRARYVTRITLSPKAYGSTSIIELQVTGTGWFPGLRKTVKAPLWEIRTNRKLQECVAEPASQQRDIREFYAAFQPVVWLVHTLGGVWRETKLVLLASHGRQLTKLYMEEGNTGPLSAWSLDARGKFWRGPEAFDYLVKVDPSANDNWLAKLRRPRE